MKTSKYSSIKRDQRVNLSFAPKDFDQLIKLAEQEDIPHTTLCYIIIKKELDSFKGFEPPQPCDRAPTPDSTGMEA